MKLGYWDVPLSARVDDELDTSIVPAFDLTLIRLYVALNIIGLVGMILMVMTASISRKVKRLSTWYSFCVSWILSCSSYLLLFLTGQQTSLNPVYWLLLGPYSILLVIFIGVAVYTNRSPGTLQKVSWGTYCRSTNPDWARISWIVVAVVSMAIIVVQGQLAARLYSNFHSIRRGSQSFATMLRGMLFTLIGFINLVVAMVLVVTNVHDLTFDIIISLFPILGLIVFGSQMVRLAYVLDLLEKVLVQRERQSFVFTTSKSLIDQGPDLS
ncbi:hypothetical protein JR316_0009768 [Psilocybe cubensis]|uniref:Uncharacterized protein n=2 Tax=Psilocybe cubensis TaxID=181762 RepID=A0A8H7XPC6_PSICU|nr:hypothetical protein JR316_0009768 [Psilocybe cubensis]KAH9477546.1 hypothetical protein JR316_0009768 [Psilocybe cubensis]